MVSVFITLSGPQYCYLSLPQICGPVQSNTVQNHSVKPIPLQPTARQPPVQPSPRNVSTFTWLCFGPNNGQTLTCLHNNLCPIAYQICIRYIFSSYSLYTCLSYFSFAFLNARRIVAPAFHTPTYSGKLLLVCTVMEYAMAFMIRLLKMDCRHIGANIQ